MLILKIRYLWLTCNENHSKLWTAVITFFAMFFVFENFFSFSFSDCENHYLKPWFTPSCYEGFVLGNFIFLKIKLFFFKTKFLYSNVVVVVVVAVLSWYNDSAHKSWSKHSTNVKVGIVNFNVQLPIVREKISYKLTINVSVTY